MKRSGFRCVHQRNWDEDSAIRKQIWYERNGLHVGLALDEDQWDIDVATTEAPRDGDVFSVAEWARWLGLPLSDPFSVDEKSTFVLAHLDDLQRQVGASNGRAIQETTRTRRRTYAQRAAQVRPRVHAVLKGSEQAVPQPAIVEARLTYILFRVVEPLSSHGVLLGLSLEDLIRWADLMNQKLPTEEELGWSLSRGWRRGWLSIGEEGAKLTRDGPRSEITLNADGLRNVREIMGTGNSEEMIRRLAGWMEANPTPRETTSGANAPKQGPRVRRSRVF